MLFVLKKRNLVAFSLVVLSAIFLVSYAKKTEKTLLVSSIPGFNRTVLIDAGHGTPDGGAVGNGIVEKDINLKIASFLQGFLEQGGSHVLMTRSDDNGIFDDSAKGAKAKKISDIKNREKMMNSSGADIFVSIHMNKFSESKYSGPQVFYAKTKNSKELALSLKQMLIEFLNPKENREIKETTSDIYLLKNAKIPAVLVECGFLSNEEEAMLLNDEEYQKNVAWAIYCGICDYFSKNTTEK